MEQPKTKNQKLREWLNRYEAVIDETIEKMAYNNHIDPITFFMEIDKLYARKRHFKLLIHKLC